MKQTHKSLNEIFNFNYSFFLSQVVVVDLVHEILQQQFFPSYLGHSKRRYFAWMPISLTIHAK